MARTRNIKPSFFQNDALGELSPLARLLFIGMWTIADYKGCLELRPKRIKAQLLPYDDCNIDALVSDLDKSRFVTIYSVKGQRYIKISNFEKHQNPHPNEKKTGSDIPDISGKDKKISDLPSLEKDHEQNVTDPALSLIPYPSSLTPQQGAAAPLVGVAIEARPEVLDAIEQQLAENLTEPTPVPKRAKPRVIELPDWLPREAWDAFVAMRKKIRKPLTDGAIPLAIKKLGELRTAGHDPRAVLEQSVMNSWQGLFEVSAGGGGGRKNGGAPAMMHPNAQDYSSNKAAMQRSIQQHGVALDGDLSF